MDDAARNKIERHCLNVLSGQRKDGDAFMDSPTFYLSRAPLRDRLWLLVFLEALIASENQSEEYFEIDYVLAVNEYLVRRSDLSVRMLSSWIAGRRFSSMQEVTDFLNDRYRTTCQFFRDNQLLCRREWRSRADRYRALWAYAVSALQDIPQEIRPYDEHLGDRGFRENPVAYLLSMREEERLRYIALLSITIYIHEGRDRTNPDRPHKSCREFVREFGNLLNMYIKYPEDPEVQPLMLMVHMDMNSLDFRDDRKRKAYFNDYLRMVAYLWHTNADGCRMQMIGNWDEYSTFFSDFPANPDEPFISDLYLDEAVLNIPEFKDEPLGFLHYQMTRSQCIHFLTMLFAFDQEPENAALSAVVAADWIMDPSAETSAPLDNYFGWSAGTQDERAGRLEALLAERIGIWRRNLRNCRRIVKANWKGYEAAYGHAAGIEPLPEELLPYEELLTDPDFVRDPVSLIRRMDASGEAAFIDFCAALNGRDAHDAALFADAMLVWLENSRNDSAVQQMRRAGDYSGPASGDEMTALREFFEKAAVSFKFNYGGFREKAVKERGTYMEELTRVLDSSRDSSYAREFRSYQEIIRNEEFKKHTCAYLRSLSQVQCERFLMYLAAATGAAPHEALRFAVLFKNILFYPNDGLRQKADIMLEKYSRTDEERMKNIRELILAAAGEAAARGDKDIALEREWAAYDDAYRRHQDRQKKNHWELNERNVERLFRFVRTGSLEPSAMMPQDKGAVTVKLLGDEKPLVLRFKDIALNSERLYSEQTGEILRYMLGQLEIIHLREENRSGRTYPVTYKADMLRVRRGAYGEKTAWTDSENIVCELLYMAVGAELLPPLHQSANKRTGEVTLMISPRESGADKIEVVKSS